MYDLFFIKTYELLRVFSHGMTDYHWLKCDKYMRERIEIHKSFRLWCIVHFLKQTKAQG